MQEEKAEKLSEEELLTQLRKQYEIDTEEEFEAYKKKALIALTTGEHPGKEKILTIVGGQPGAGKSRLMALTKQKLEAETVIVNFDELRALHPSYEEASAKHTEIVHKILQYDTNEVKKQVLEELIKGGYSVLYEGALRDTQGFIDFAKDFKENGYTVKLNVMAVPKLESYGSTLYRYATALLTDQTPRWVEKYAHDEAYVAMIKTMQEFEKSGLLDTVKVFERGKDRPREIYSTEQSQFESAIAAVQYGREVGRRKAIEDFPAKYTVVRDTLKIKQPELLKNLDPWKEFYEEEKAYFEKIDNKEK